MLQGSYYRDFPLKSSLSETRVYQTMAEFNQVRATLLKVADQVSALGRNKSSSGKVLK
jgi:hypothetical protein